MFAKDKKLAISMMKSHHGSLPTNSAIIQLGFGLWLGALSLVTVKNVSLLWAWMMVMWFCGLLMELHALGQCLCWLRVICSSEIWHGLNADQCWLPRLETQKRYCCKEIVEAMIRSRHGQSCVPKLKQMC